MKASEVLELHRNSIRALGRKYAAKGISNLRVFGSVATGTDTEESDIDFLIDAEQHVTLFTIGGLYSELEHLVKRNIDLVISDEIPQHFKRRILEEAKAI